MTALVIGGSKGIGAAIAGSMALHGHAVRILDTQPPQVLQTRTQYFPGDIRDSTALEAACDGLTTPLRHVAITPAVNVRKPVGELTCDELRSVFELNVIAYHGALKVTIPRIADGGGGSVVVISSIRARRRGPGQGAYSASKIALEALCQAWAGETSASGVRINIIAPGAVRTDFSARLWQDPALERYYASRSNLNRWASPGEIAAAAVWLLGPDAAFINGAVLAVDGGWLAYDREER